MVAEHPRVAGGELGAGRPPRGRLARPPGAVRPRGEQPIAELPAALIAAHQGRIEDARDRSERALALAEADGIRIAQSGHRWVLGFIELSRGDPATALGYLERSWEIRDSVRVLEPGHRLELADTLEALIAVGELEEAERSSYRGRSAPGRSTARGRWRSRPVAARSSSPRGATRGRPGGLRARAGRARADSGSVPARAHAARAGHHAAASEAARRRPPDARAGARASSSGSARRSGPSRRGAELARIGGRAPSRDELTEAERRIAALVAEGRTNREVAAALFVTEHTVEGALTRAYRKLGVRSRAELAHRLGQET